MDCLHKPTKKGACPGRDGYHNFKSAMNSYISEIRKRKPRCFLQLERPRGPVLFEDDFPLPLKLSLEVVGAPCN